jgi:hypothetical protein
MTRPETPFPRHWFYYIALKYAVLVGPLVITLYLVYQLW